LEVIDEFTSFLWTGIRSPAKVYVQQTQLPLILTMAADGSYSEAMRSSESMAELVHRMSYLSDQATNMDW
jgi:hypothetical protein